MESRVFKLKVNQLEIYLQTQRQRQMLSKTLRVIAEIAHSTKFMSNK